MEIIIVITGKENKKMNYKDYTAKELKEQFGIDVDDDNMMYRVHSDTGEIQALQTVYIPYGTTILTPQDRTNMQAQRERQAYINYQNTQRAEQLKKTGHFYFVKREYDFDLKPETLARLLYLISYMSADGTLKTTQRKYMHRDALCDVLGLSHRVVLSFLREVKDKYIAIDSTGLIRLTDNCSKLFKCGGIKGDSYTRIYRECIQSLYKTTDNRRHRYLGLIFKLLKYINLEYNILCLNPFENDVNKIEPIDFNKFCDMFGHSGKDIYRVRNIFNQIKFKTKTGTFERFCVVAKFYAEEDITRIIINPNVLYCGTDINKVKALVALKAWS